VRLVQRPNVLQFNELISSALRCTCLCLLCSSVRRVAQPTQVVLSVSRVSALWVRNAACLRSKFARLPEWLLRLSRRSGSDPVICVVCSLVLARRESFLPRNQELHVPRAKSKKTWVPKCLNSGFSSAHRRRRFENPQLSLNTW
jgi:hypothetical protein